MGEEKNKYVYANMPLFTTAILTKKKLVLDEKEKEIQR